MVIRWWKSIYIYDINDNKSLQDYEIDILFKYAKGMEYQNWYGIKVKPRGG